jgi:CRP-like cAMP-binding protein
MRTKDQRIDALRAVPLLSGLSGRDLAQVLALAKEQELRAGEVIVKAGDLAQDFYLLARGHAKLTVPRRGTVMLGPGDYFGEMSVLDGGPRTATIVAEGPGWALRIGRQDFLRLLDAHPSIARKILVELSKRVRVAEGANGRH